MRKDGFVRDEGVAGSNPATPTKLPEVLGPNPDSFPDSCSPRHPAEGGFVYFISDGEAIKIGFSEKPLRRLSSIQSHHSKPLTLLGTASATVMDEHSIHQRFSHIRIRGEWFRPTPELVKFANELCKKAKPPEANGASERRALRELAAAYKGNSIVAMRVRILLAQMARQARETDPHEDADLRAKMAEGAQELGQIIRDGGKYVTEHHSRAPTPRWIAALSGAEG